VGFAEPGWSAVEGHDAVAVMARSALVIGVNSFAS
jgi:hypothetical protein